MYCPHCGTQVMTGGARFCYECGQDIGRTGTRLEAGKEDTRARRAGRSAFSTAPIGWPAGAPGHGLHPLLGVAGLLLLLLVALPLIGGIALLSLVVLFKIMPLILVGLLAYWVGSCPGVDAPRDAAGSNRRPRRT